MILSLEADAIAFQEVQNGKNSCGELFRTRVNPKDQRQQYRFTSFVCIPARDPRGINVALATRLAVNGTLTFHDEDFGPLDEHAKRFSRDLLGVELFATKSYRFLFFVAHLKSKLRAPIYGVGKRALETHEIRTILETPQFGGNPFIAQDMVLCGDMNDDPGSEAVAILKGGGPTELVDVLGQLESAMSFPTHHRYKKTRLDYILASPTLSIGDAKIRTDEEEAPEASIATRYPPRAGQELAWQIVALSPRRTAILKLGELGNPSELRALDVQRVYPFELTIDGRVVGGGGYTSPLGDQVWRDVMAAMGRAVEAENKRAGRSAAAAGDGTKRRPPALLWVGLIAHRLRRLSSGHRTAAARNHLGSRRAARAAVGGDGRRAVVASRSHRPVDCARLRRVRPSGRSDGSSSHGSQNVGPWHRAPDRACRRRSVDQGVGTTSAFNRVCNGGTGAGNRSRGSARRSVERHHRSRIGGFSRQADRGASRSAVELRVESDAAVGRIARHEAAPTTEPAGPGIHDRDPAGLRGPDCVPVL